MARRDISGLYFNTDIGPVPTPPGPELTSSKMRRRSSRTRSRVTGGMRAIMLSSRVYPEDASRRVITHSHGIILPAVALDNIRDFRISPEKGYSIDSAEFHRVSGQTLPTISARIPR